MDWRTSVALYIESVGLLSHTEEDQMLCRMPVVGLPDDLRHELESGQLISNTGRYGVAVYWSSHQHTRVDIYN